VPTHWTWDFGDGGSSSEPDPRHVFTAPGDYTVTLRAANGFGEDVLARTAYVSVAPPPSIVTYLPVADARVNQSAPGSNYGSDAVLRLRNAADGSYHSYLRFDLSALPAPATSVKLRLFCTDAGNSGGSIYAVANDTWLENTINWNNRPALPASPLATLGGVSAGFWAEIELGPGAVEQGLVSLAIAGGTSNSVYYSSRETANPPQLVVTLLGGGTPPVAAFEGAPHQGPAPLAVDFTDLSTNVPSNWSWDFGDGGHSTERNPTHVYTVPGVYTVLLDVGNGAGLDSLTRLDYVVVEAPPPVQAYLAAADARVTESSANRNYGGETTLRVRSQSGGSSQSFLRFDVTTLAGPVVDAKLRVFCTDGSSSGGALYGVPTTWTETGVTWNNRPALPPTALASLGATVAGQWYEVDVGAAVTGTGTFAFALAGGNTNTALYSSREGANPPELVIETGQLLPPDADFDAAPLTGVAPLQVSFTDLSVGSQSLAWTFGDGGTSTERDPVHVYAAPGVYSVTLEVSNALGTDGVTRTNLITVTGPPPVRTFVPIADTRVNEASPIARAGSQDNLRIREAAGGSYHTYLRFDLSTVTGTMVSARLRLFSTDGSPVAGLVYPTSNTWSEATLDWNTRPGPTGALVTSGGAVATNEWAEFDVTSAVTGPGVLNLVIQSSSSNSCYYSSREGLNPPELIVETAAP
jgi:PKD repeat protein